MRKLIYSALALFMTAFMMQASHAQEEGKAGILVTPTRVVLEGKNRSASISLANNGNKEGNYKLEFVNKRMTESGGIVNADKAMEGELFADDILRISPRRVFLKPGDHQNIRILLRKPKDLPDGEYRTHLNFILAPDDDLTQREQDNKQKKNEQDSTLTISIRANFGVTIPVIVRNGNLSVAADMSDISLSKGEDGKPKILFTVNRNGGKSLYGDIKIIHMASGGKETMLKSLGGLAVYTPNKKRKFDIPLDLPDIVDLKNGRIDIIYQEKAEDGGDIITRGTLKL